MWPLTFVVLLVVVTGCRQTKSQGPESPPTASVAIKPVVAPDAAAASEADAGPEVRTPTRCAQVGQSSVSRYGSTGTVLADGRILLVGSTEHDAAGPYSPVVEELDLETKRLTIRAPLNVGRAKHAAVRLPNDRVLVVGGMSDEKTPFSQSVEIYNPTANRWTAIMPIVEGAIEQGIAALADGRVVLVGGDVMLKGRKLARLVTLDPKTLRWTAGPNAPIPRAGTLIGLGDGRLLFTGDASGWSGDESATVDLFDPATRAWSSMPSPLRARPVERAVRVSANVIALLGRELVDGGMRGRIMLVDDALTPIQELPVPDDPSIASCVAVDGELYVIAQSSLHRWDAARRAWSKSTIEADGCSTAIPIPARGERRGRLLFAGRCGSAMGALELCDL